MPDDDGGDIMDLDDSPRFQLLSPDIRNKIRTSWSNCEGPEDLAKLAELSIFASQVLNSEFQYVKLSGMEYTKFIRWKAMDHIKLIQLTCDEKQLHCFRRFTFPTSGSDQDDVMVAYLCIMNVYDPSELSYDHLPSRSVSILTQLFPSAREKAKTSSASRQENLAMVAFQQQPVGRKITGAVYSKIVDYFKSYGTNAGYIAPYTTIIGPSGIGKTYLVKQIAHQNYAYVLYACLGKNSSHVYPYRSLIADFLLCQLRREQTTTAFETYIAAGLVNVKLCQKYGITPAGFFDLQENVDYEGFQKALSNGISKLFQIACNNIGSSGEPRKNRSDEVRDFDYTEYIDQSLDSYEKAMDPIFQSIRGCLAQSKKSSLYLSTKPINTGESLEEPTAVFAIDEARSLFDHLNSDLGPMRYLAMRRAMRHRWHSRRQGRFFAILLDTSSRVTDLSPPPDKDPSAKWPHDDMLFAPIFEVDTMDIYMQGVKGYDPAHLLSGDERKREKALTHLYSYGRPLWGAYLRTGSIAHSALEKFVQTKLYGRTMPPSSNVSATDSIALISYRLNFYVALYHLAEVLSSDYLRYVVGLNESRTLLQTMQPSEPILAFAASREMLDQPKRRLSAIQALYDNVAKGFVSLGDVGEAVASMVLMFAFDKAHGQQQPRPINLSKFLSTLLSEQTVKRIKERTKEHKQMAQLWDGGFVFFSHVVRLSEAPSQETLKMAFGRSAALLPPQGFKGADLIIPVQTKSRMSYILVQVKNRRDSTMKGSLKIEARQSLFLAANLLHDTPHFGLFLSLRSKKDKHAVEVICPEETGPNVTRSTKPDQKYQWENTPRIVVATVGLSLDVFPGISFPESSDAQKETTQILTYFKHLLSQTTEVPKSDDGNYYKNLTPLC